VRTTRGNAVVAEAEGARAGGVNFELRPELQSSQRLVDRFSSGISAGCPLFPKSELSSGGSGAEPPAYLMEVTFDDIARST
jgi:hypothetical protein